VATRLDDASRFTPDPPAPTVLGLRGDLVGRRAAYVWTSTRHFFWPRSRARRLILLAITLVFVLELAVLFPGLSLGARALVVLGLLAATAVGSSVLLWCEPPTRRRVLYATPDGAAVIRARARRGNRWELDQHVKLHDDADAPGLRAVLFPPLLQAARDRGVTVTLTAAAERLAQIYEQDVLSAQKDVAEPTPLRRVPPRTVARRRLPRLGIRMRWDPPRD
jgi:hypothetical protein